jgi:hypothetical protein
MSDTSDVYVYADAEVGRLRCCGCMADFSTTAGMIEHLREHIERVQMSVSSSLRSSSFIGGGEVASSQHGGFSDRRRPTVARPGSVSASDAAGLLSGVC